MSADSRSVLLDSLKAAAAYQFRVSAVNSVGEGPPSDPSNVVALPQEREGLIIVDSMNSLVVDEVDNLRLIICSISALKSTFGIRRIC